MLNYTVSVIVTSLSTNVSGSSDKSGSSTAGRGGRLAGLRIRRGAGSGLPGALALAQQTPLNNINTNNSNDL